MTIEWLEMAEALAQRSKEFKLKHGDTLKSVMDAATALQSSWSGSNLGYHAFVYYNNLRPRPPGSQFSSEWGLMDMGFASMGSHGDWREYSPAVVKKAVYEDAGNPDLTDVERDSKELARTVEQSQGDLISSLSVVVDSGADEFLRKLYDEAEGISVLSARTLSLAMLPHGRMISRDSNAITGGRQLAPHQEVIVRISAMQVPADVADKLSKIARKAGSHLARKQTFATPQQRTETSVFIGHGRSALWRELKDFVVDRLKLPYEEFNRVPVAGVANTKRLLEMLDGAGCALIVLTAEDEQKDGAMRARMNVIHEAGLFQGRLGFTKAIVLLEEGCEEFSNIHGLGQIRFPSNNIAAIFENVRAVLEREGMI